ncbi:TetR/AcrR family transcriptional regulator [Leisingera sp. ANG-Vp]|uniref:TetR/AcrR family transcriptional regulator n=1 Tax=Leisingera sp. ANG-Vp TaxID=1577896 RepID=UPI00187C3555|nr:TetR/AcrR family transcriptional regulator [Leisingera sp. ANG-Vp]
MSRPRQFDEKDALEGAMMLFWKRGYGGTNLPDLLDAMGLTRGSFYKAFTDKHSVYLQALDHYGETRMARALGELTDRNGPPPHERLTNFFYRTENTPLRPAPRIGCFLCNVMVEMAPFDAESEARCHRISQRLWTALYSIVQESAPDQPRDVLERKATALQRLYLGSHAMGRMGASFDAWPDLLQELL